MPERSIFVGWQLKSGSKTGGRIEGREGIEIRPCNYIRSSNNTPYSVGAWSLELPGGATLEACRISVCPHVETHPPQTLAAVTAIPALRFLLPFWAHLHDLTHRVKAIRPGRGFPQDVSYEADAYDVTHQPARPQSK